MSSPSEVLVKVVHGDMHTLCGDIGQLGLSLPDELGLAPALSPLYSKRLKSLLFKKNVEN